MTLDFATFSTVFQLYQEEDKGIMRESLCASDFFFLILDIQKCLG